MQTIKNAIKILLILNLMFSTLYAGSTSTILKGTWSDNLFRPTRVAINSNGNIVIADIHRKQIYLYAEDHRYISSIPITAPPLGIAFSPDDNLYVGIQGDILKINSKGDILDRFSSHGIVIQSPVDIAIDKSGSIFVVDREMNSVGIYSSSFELQHQFGKLGTGNGEFHFPIGISLDAAAGEIIVADGGNSRIQIFSTDGIFHRMFGEHIKQVDTTWQIVGTFAQMQGVAVDAEHRIYVTDSGLDHVQIFDANGNHLGFLGRDGIRSSRFHVPMGVAISSFGKLFVTSLSNSEVKEYTIQNTTGVETSKSLPIKFELQQNFPNPFNPMTQISFSLPEEGFVTLTVYDIVGREIAVLANSHYQGGSYTVEWNGRNNAGATVSSGIYFYHLQVGEKFTQTNKMIFLK